MDAGMCTAIWCAVRHCRPEAAVLETGVAHGVSSRVVLEALALNDRGHLWSIDIANPLNVRVHGPGGVMLIDDIESYYGSATFAHRHPEFDVRQQVSLIRSGAAARSRRPTPSGSPKRSPAARTRLHRLPGPAGRSGGSKGTPPSSHAPGPSL